jgi:hypothetical protein
VKSARSENDSQAPELVPVSNDTVTRRILSVSEDIKKELLTRIKCGPGFALKWINQQTL